MDIHPLASISPQAQLGHNVRVGPFAIVEDDVAIGDDCELAAHVVVKSGTTIGAANRVFEHTVIGGLPQHLRIPDRPGRVAIGSGNVLRENVTVHRALDADHATTIGDNCLLMVGAHVAHDCHVGDHAIVANNAMLAGHVTVEQRAYISGAVGIHQFCRVGTLAMVGGQAHVVRDVPPFVMVDGVSTAIAGLNRVGLKRAGYSSEAIAQLKAAYRLIYRSGLPWTKVLDYLAVDFPTGPAAKFREFFLGGTRGFIPARRTPTRATLLLHDDGEASTAQQVKAG
ncbi:MAG: acyl-ACP--UDP-N-acetylglucosamine O-acyltransferase [Pirellulales bacterium]